MKETPNHKRTRRGGGDRVGHRFSLSSGILLALAFSAGLGCPAFGEGPAGPDTLFLRDGSVLQGTVLRDAEGGYHVSNSLYGKVAVDESAVLYFLPGPRDMPIHSENQVILPGTLEVLTTFSRAVPERSGGSPAFRLLVPGSVDAVHAADGSLVPSESRDVAGSSLVTVDYARLGESVDRIFITSVQKEILTARENGNLAFRTKRILDEAGTIRLVVEYPQEWSIESLSPEPTFRFPGMVVWEVSLKRQQTFQPAAVFVPTEARAVSVDPGATPGEGE